MRVPRIFQAIELHTGNTIVLDEQRSHYALQVLRLKPNSKLFIFNHLNQEFAATLVAQNKNRAQVQIANPIHREVESPLHIHLVQGISRGEKMDFTIQKATELGVNEITPIFTEFCNVQLNKERAEKKLLHWQNIAISACEQSGRTMVPTIHSLIHFEKWLGTIADSDGLKLILNPQKSNTAIKFNSAKKIILLIGSEGGLSENEIKLAQTHNFTNLQLGPRILRTETAALTAISILQSHLGDMKLSFG